MRKTPWNICWIGTVALAGLVRGAVPLDTYVESAHPRYPALPFPLVANLPETEAELRRAYPGLEQTFRRFIEFGINQCLPEFEMKWLETPHVKWAAPHAGGTLRVLFVKYNRYAAGGQDIREICQRMDLDASLLIVPSENRAHRTSALMPVGVEKAFSRAAEVLAEDYDVIVMNDDAHFLSADLLETIRDKVRAGAGLVFFRGRAGHTNAVSDALPLVAPGNPAPWTADSELTLQDHTVVRGIPFEVFPATALRRLSAAPEAAVIATVDGFPLAATGTIGKGRVAVFAYDWAGLVGHGYALKPSDQFEDLTEKRYPWWEYNFGLIARAILWAAHREASVTLRVEGPPPAVAYGQSVPLRVALENVPRDASYAAALRVRGPEYEPEIDLRRELNGRESAVWTVDLQGRVPGAADADGSSAVRFLPPGRHFADCLVRDAQGRAVEWASVTFEVEPAVVAEVELDREVLGGEQTVELTLSAEPLDGALRDREARWEIEAWDSWNRRIDAATRPVEWGRRISVPVRVDGAQSVITRVKVRIREPHGIAYSASRECFRPRFGWDDWKTVIWRRNQRFFGWRHEIEMYRSLGFAAGYANTWAHRISFYRKFAEVGLEPMVVNWDYPDIRKNNLGKVLRRYGGIFLSVADEWRPPFWGAWDLPFADEDRPRDLIHGRRTTQSLDRADFIRWLQRRYGGDLRAFNASWGTAFETWDAFQALTTEQVIESGQYAGWLEPRLYFDEQIEKEYDRVHAQYAEEAGEPIMVGFEGCFSFQGTFIGGMDYTRMCREHQTIGLYHTEDGQELMGHTCVADIVSTLSPPWTLFSLTSGSCYGPPESYFRDPWLMAFRGGRGWLVYNASTLTSDFGALYRRGLWVRDATRELREGLGKLLMQSVPDAPEVGVLYCTPSTYLHTLRNRADRSAPSAFAWVQGRHAYTRIFRDMQVPFRYIRWTAPSPQELDGLKLVCLTSCEYLPPAWAGVLEAFVRRGGVVFADMPVGFFDEHGNPGGGAAFDGLFGIRQTGGRVQQQSPWYSAGLTVLEPQAVTFPVQTGGWYPTSVYAERFELTDGTAFGVNYIPDPRPALIAKETGNGMAMVATFLLDGYVAHGSRPKVAGYYHALMSALMQRAGCRRVKAVVDPADPGVALPGLFVNGFHSDGGRVQYLTAMRALDIPQDAVRFAFERPGHLYDVRTGTYLGEAAHAQVDLGRGLDGGATVVACLPYRIEGVNLEVPAVATAGGALSVRMGIGAELNGERCATHVFRVELFDPDGDRAEPYCRNLVAQEGQTVLRLPLALNEKRGTWRMTVRDVLSGERAEAQIAVR